MHLPCVLPLIKLKTAPRLAYLHCIALSHQHDTVFAIPGRVPDIRNRIHIYMVAFVPSEKSKLSTCFKPCGIAD
jgi:hypothetical protein